MAAPFMFDASMVTTVVSTVSGAALIVLCLPRGAIDTVMALGTG